MVYRDFSEHDVILISLLTKVPPKTNVSDDFLIIFLSKMELANLILSQETKKLSSGKISARSILILVRYSRLVSPN